MNVQTQTMMNNSILSDAFKSNPYPTFRWWHAHAEPFRDPDQNYWVVFNYDQVRTLLRDPRLTVARYGEVPSDPTERARDAHVRNLLSMWMLNMDGAAHDIARKDLMPMFSNRALADYAALVRQQVDCCVETLGSDGHWIEAYREIAFPLPARIVLSIMGLEDLDETDLEEVRRFSDVISTYVGSAGRAPGCIGPTFEALNTFCDFLTRKIDVTRSGFERTLTARLIEIYGQGKPLAESVETLSNIILFVVSGFETTTNLILNTLLALGRDRQIEVELRAYPDRIGDFIDETLRMHPPVNRTARKALADIQVGGKTIAAGDLVILFLGAANRDPLVFPDPDSFRIVRAERRENSVLSFGYGPHLCIGRLLSIMELRIFYETLLARYISLDVDLEGLRFRDGSVLKGIAALKFAARVS
jgi:cytochrome P450